jgi:prepilin-type processing-associated H-X9-DG protein/prepilin-type N-terminal cleavage/methylation domain-containing protein
MRNVRQHGRRGGTAGTEGFSLLELLIVITIIGILAALLIPGFQGAREAMWTAQCRTNLRTLYEAYGVRRADCVQNEQGVWEPARDVEFEDTENAARFWTALVANYIDPDKQPVVFTCPARAAWGYGVAYEEVEEQNVQTAGGASGSSGGGGPGGTDVWQPANDEIDAAIEFDVYFQSGSEGNVFGGGSNSGVRGEFCYTIPLGNSAWVQRREYSDHTNYRIDDEPSEGRSGNFDDLEINVYYEGNQPSQVEIVGGQMHSSGSVARRFIFDLKICGEVVIEDVAGQLQGGTSHWGDTIDLMENNDGTGSGAFGGWHWDGEQWVSSHPWDFKILVGDYAMSMGVFQRRDSSLVQDQVDGQLFFLLDFGARKTVADFNRDESDDDWEKYFIRDVRQWAEDFPDAARKGWQYYQALRHAGRANVVFCDGHIEALSAEDLEYLDPRWVYRGR